MSEISDREISVVFHLLFVCYFCYVCVHLLMCLSHELFARRYDLSSSSGESSPEMPSLSKRTSYRLSPVATASGLQGKKPLDASPGYNSAEEYDGSRRPYVDAEVRDVSYVNIVE